jgi:spermidine synthase
MRRWEVLDRAPVPGAGGVLSLMRRAHEFAIAVDGHQLMSSSAHGSEDALGELARDRVGARADARMLLGGLGMGFTLAAALRGLGPGASVTVAELVPAVVAWNRGALGEVAGRPLDDPRVAVFEGDVAAAIRAGVARWDAVVLDVDNGPAGLTSPANEWLYGRHGLEAARAALRPGGVLAVWSAGPDRAFARRVERAGFAVETFELRARGARGGQRHLAWLATRAERRD